MWIPGNFVLRPRNTGHTNSGVKMLKVKTHDGLEVIHNDPPELTPEILDKLEKTAYHLAEISKLWGIPDLGVVDSDIMSSTDMYEEGIAGFEMQRRNYIYEWYREAPFVPLFFNSSYYKYLSGKMLELSVKETSSE
jgi:hypothetical protein